jgi:hypothetical protein
MARMLVAAEGLFTFFAWKIKFYSLPAAAHLVIGKKL